MEREEIAKMFDVIVEICISGNRVYDVCELDDDFYKETKQVLEMPFNKGYKAFYGAKWTNKGLIYTHKLNEKYEFEPIEDDK